MSPEATLHSTLNQTPEQGRKWETNLTVYMVWNSNYLSYFPFLIRISAPIICQFWDKTVFKMTKNLGNGCDAEGERVPVPPGPRAAYQRALSMDSKPMGGEGAAAAAAAGGLAGRRNVPCPTLVKQENVEAPFRIGGVPNGFPGGGGVCPPRGNLTSK